MVDGASTLIKRHESLSLNDIPEEQRDYDDKADLTPRSLKSLSPISEPEPYEQIRTVEVLVNGAESPQPENDQVCVV